MKTYGLLYIFLMALYVSSCAETQKPAQKIISPMETLKKFSEAAKSKDIETAKSLMTKESLEQRITYAESQKITLNELLSKDDGLPFKKLPETKNEEILGDKATIEVKNPFLQTWIKLIFIKEDNAWKIDLVTYGKTLKEDLMKEFLSPEAKTPPKSKQ